MKNETIGGCGKHPGQSMLNCPICSQEKMRESIISAKESANHLIDKFKRIQIATLTDKESACCALVSCKEIINVLDNNRSINWCNVINADKKHWQLVKMELERILAP